MLFIHKKKKQQKEKSMRLWKLMDNPSGYPQLPQLTPRLLLLLGFFLVTSIMSQRILSNLPSGNIL